MPIHDWTLRPDDGTFHYFHLAWCFHLTEALNEGILPGDFYAIGEQSYLRRQADVLTLQVSHRNAHEPPEGAIAVAELPPQVELQSVRELLPLPQARQRRVVVKRATNDQVVAWIEIVSPANKDRPSHVEDFAFKITQALAAGLHGILIDLLPPGPSDPTGMHGAIWREAVGEDYVLDQDRPLTVVSYQADTKSGAYVQPLAVGTVLHKMPLFLDADWYVNVPLEETYTKAFRSVPKQLRERYWES